jgi:hypothetical protein
MTRFFIALALMFTACAPTDQTTASPMVAPHKPRIDGNIHAVSVADIRTVLALMPAHFTEQYFEPVPIARIHVIDHNTMSVHYWPDRSTFARRIKGHWRIDYGDTEKSYRETRRHRRPRLTMRWSERLAALVPHFR